MTDYKYQAYVCNNIIYGGLVQLNASGVSEEDKRTMLKCIGDTLVKMSFLDKPIDYYIKHYEDYKLKGGNENV